MPNQRTSKREVYEIVTDRIIQRMEAGHIPWGHPWNPAVGLPRNIVGRQYRGINVWILGAQGYESPVWLTFNQAKEMGGHVKASEKPTPVVFWKLLGHDKENEDGSIDHKVFPLMRYYNVFNLEQCENLPVKASEPSIFADRKPIEAAEAIIAGMPLRPDIRETRHDEGNPPHYSSHLDYVDMPLKSQFSLIENWYSVLVHELGHSSGHPDRLNRKSLAEYGAVPGARNQEELLAEFTSGYLCAVAGILNTSLSDNKAAYIHAWLRAIKDERKMLIVAAAQAQNAADYILVIKEQPAELAEAA